MQPALCIAQVKLTATATPKIVGKEEAFEYRLMLENTGSIEKIVPPDLSRFIVLSGPNQESRMESINGVTRRYSGITYILKSKTTGRITITPAQVVADGKRLESNTVTLTVTQQPQGNSQAQLPFGGLSPFDEPQPSAQQSEWVLQKGENVQDKINKNIFILTETDKKFCYVGEPIVVTYKLYTRLKSESNIVKNPSFNGFSVIDLLPPGSITPVQEKIKGRLYNVYILRKAQLYPLQAGEAELESAAIENDIQFVKQEYLERQRRSDDFFDDFFQPSLPREAFVQQKITLQSKPVFITVKPLPDAGKPADFNGAVGQFSIDAFAQKTTGTTDDANRLVVKISGSGNIGLITVPDIQWPENIEAYEPVVKEVVNKMSVQVSGQKIFEYPFSVLKAGTYTLPPVNFSYFDAAAGKYKTAATTAITLTIANGTGNKTPLSNGQKQDNKKNTFFEQFFLNRWLLITALLLLVIAGFWVVLQKNKRDTDAAPIEPVVENKLSGNSANTPIPAEALAIARQKMEAQDAKAFYMALYKALRTMLCSRLPVAADADKRTIMVALDKSGMALHQSLEWQQLLNEIELQIYTPVADADAMPVHYAKALLLADQLQKQTG